MTIEARKKRILASVQARLETQSELDLMRDVERARSHAELDAIEDALAPRRR
ncbi:hypothetical protein [Petrachloros mirabilis]